MRTLCSPADVATQPDRHVEPRGAQNMVRQAPCFARATSKKIDEATSRKKIEDRPISAAWGPWKVGLYIDLKSSFVCWHFVSI